MNNDNCPMPMQKYEVEGHEFSVLPGNKKWKMVFNDEFDGPELDRSKWDFRLHMVGKRHECYIEDAISFDGNSNIVFHLVEKDGKYYSSTLQTGENYTDKPNGESKLTKPKFLHSYGYYECRCKLQQEHPWWSAFWLQSPTVAMSEDSDIAGVEVDILESFIPNVVHPHCLHWGGYGENHKWASAEGYSDWKDYYGTISVEKDKFHRFGCLWEEDGYTFFVNGIQIGKKVTEISTSVENFVCLFTECKGYRPEFIVPDMAEHEFVSGIKDEFVVDYVRVFDEVK